MEMLSERSEGEPQPKARRADMEMLSERSEGEPPPKARRANMEMFEGGGERRREASGKNARN